MNTMCINYTKIKKKKKVEPNIGENGKVRGGCSGRGALAQPGEDGFSVAGMAREQCNLGRRVLGAKNSLHLGEHNTCFQPQTAEGQQCTATGGTLMQAREEGSVEVSPTDSTTVSAPSCCCPTLGIGMQGESPTVAQNADR